MRRALLGLVCALPTISFASPITLDWTGQISRAYEYSSSAGETEIALNDTSVHGSFTYDPDLIAAANNIGFGNSWIVQMPVGGPDVVQSTTTWERGVFTPNSAGQAQDIFDVYDNPTPMGWDPVEDLFQVEGQQYDGPIFQQFTIGLLGVDMMGSGPAYNPSPFTIPNVNQATYGYGSLQWQNGPWYNAYGYRAEFNVTSASVHPTSVPEPSTCLLFASGIAAALRFRRRRAR